MRKVLAASGLVFLFACVGGSGELPDQGPDQANQGGGVHQLPGRSASTTSSDDRGSSANPPTTATTTPTSPPQNQTITGIEFDRDCNVDSDCVVVFQGGTCSACKCPNTAIATKDKSDYDRKLAERSTGCSTPTNVQCAPCQAYTATCDTRSKTCSTRTQ